HRIRPIQVLQSWRRHRHDSDVETGVVHRGDALGVDFEESGGELIIRRMDERNVLPSRLQCVPRVDQLGCREVFFQTNDLHVLDDKRVYYVPDYGLRPPSGSRGWPRRATWR